ncbi:thioredoxin [Haloferacaceae archaeon DSL9]
MSTQSLAEPIRVESADEFADLIDEHEIVLVDYYADWCGPCKMLEPTVEAVAAESDAAVLKVDIDALRDLAEEKGIRSVPTLEFYRDGESVDRVVGVQEKESLLDAIAELE